MPFQGIDIHIDAGLITYSYVFQRCLYKLNNYKIVNRKGGRSPINYNKLCRVISIGMENSNMALIFEIDEDLINYS